jgi:hypothetical protein
MEVIGTIVLSRDPVDSARKLTAIRAIVCAAMETHRLDMLRSVDENKFAPNPN